MNYLVVFRNARSFVAFLRRKFRWNFRSGDFLLRDILLFRNVWFSFRERLTWWDLIWRVGNSKLYSWRQQNSIYPYTYYISCQWQKYYSRELVSSNWALSSQWSEDANDVNTTEELMCCSGPHHYSAAKTWSLKTHRLEDIPCGSEDL